MWLGLGNVIPIVKNILGGGSPPIVNDFILMENSGFILKEDGSKIIKE